MICSQDHRDAIQPFSKSVRNNINDLEPLTLKEGLHALNRPNPHQPGPAILSNSIQPVVEEKPPDTLSVEIAVYHSPREHGDVFVIHSPSTACDDCFRLLDDIIRTGQLIEKIREIISIFRNKELRRIPVEDP